MRNFFKLFICFIIFSILSSCGGFQKVDTRNVPISGPERAKKNVREGRGVSLGGINKFDIGSGFDLKLGNFCLHFAASQSGGLFNSARGIKVSSDFRFIF